jgi:1,2-phenylacetyl-CoA epoxidase catalytic subunit
MKMEIKKSEKIKRSEMSKWNINKLMDEGVKEEFIKELIINLRNTTLGKQGNRNKI